MSKSSVIILTEALSKLTYLGDRTPNTTEEEAQGAFSLLSTYRDGGIFIAHYAGSSEWEQHPQGDELVQVLEGETQLITLENHIETYHLMQAGQVFVVPCGVWHRFESPKGVKVMTVTPQPTQHSVARPSTV